MIAVALLASFVCTASDMAVVQQSPRPPQYVLLTNEPKEKQPDTSQPLENADDLAKRYKPDTYYIEQGKSGRFIVIDKRLWQVEQELDALEFLVEMFKRPDPFAPVQLGQLSERVRNIALRLMYVNGTERTWVQGQKSEDIGVALGMDMIVRLVGRKRNGSMLMAAQQGPEVQARINQGLIQWALKLKDSPDGITEMEEPEEPQGQIKFLFFCDLPEHPAAMEEASNVFHRYVEGVKRQAATTIESQHQRLQAAFAKQLGGMSLPPSSNLDNWPEELRDTVTSNVRLNWQFNGFASRDDVDAFLSTVQSVKLMMSFNISFCTKRGERPPAKTGLEIYRTG